MMQEATEVIDQIIEKMFGRYKKESRRIVEDLCDRMGYDEAGNRSMGFIYKGTWVPRPGAAAVNRKQWVRPALPSHLMQEMDKAVAEEEVVRTDMKQINQLLVKLLYQCNDLEEIRDALPDCLWIYGGFSGHQRQFNQEFLYRNDKRITADMERLMPRIEFYLGMSLVL